MRILFVALTESVHSARWIAQLRHLNWELHLFPARPAGYHPDFSKITVHDTWRARPRGMASSVNWVSKSPFRKGSSTFRRIGSLRPRGRDNYHLSRLITELRPDVIHSLEMQHAGYLTHAAKELSTDFPPWVVTNWGSDIFYFQRFPEHVSRIGGVLDKCDYYTCECSRDVNLAKKFGFQGRTYQFSSNAGGFDLGQTMLLKQPGPTSARRWILLKGYQGWAGRAICGLKAIANCAELIKAGGNQVGIYATDPNVRQAAADVSRCYGIPISIIEPCSHEEMLHWHGRARVSIGLSLSDGASTSFLEALVMGSFPIQSNTACADEWIQDGESGMIVPPEDVSAIARALRRALTDDALVDTAAQANARTATARLNRADITHRVVSMYEEIAKSSNERQAAPTL